MAFTGIAAIVAGEAVTAAVVLAAVAEVGMIMTVVGGITGNETLMKIGGVMGLVGGIGGMINGAIGGATAAGAAGAEGGLNFAQGFTDGGTIGGALDSGMAASAGIVDSAAGVESFAGGAPDLTGALNPTDMRLAAGTQTTPGVMEVGPQVATNSTPAVTDVANQQGALGPTGPQTPAGPSAPKTPMDSGSFFSKFSTFAEKNKTLFSGGMQLLGGAMKGANERDMWDEKMALDQQKVNQTSFGNQVGVFAPQNGIVAGARA